MLLSAAAAEFDAFITIDQNLRYQQNLAQLPIPVLLIMAPNSRLDALLPLVPELLLRLAAPLLREVVTVGSRKG